MAASSSSAVNALTTKRPSRRAGIANRSLRATVGVKVPVPVPHLSGADGLVSVVGVGASAGGLEALMTLLDGLPPESGMAFVVIQHLAPTHKSMLVEILARHTSMPVAQAIDGMQIEPNHVYIIPPKAVAVLRL